MAKRRFAALTVGILALAGFNSAGASASSATPSSYSFQSSGLTGGGFQNVLAISPFKSTLKQDKGARPYLDGADVAGIQRSTDRGASWSHIASGAIHVATLMWSTSVPGTAFAGSNEGLFKSTNWGLTWARAVTLNVKPSSPIDFDGNGAYDVNNAHQPRATGNLLAQNSSGTRLWVGTSTNGLMQFSNNGKVLKLIAHKFNTPKTPDNIRSIAVDPNNPNVLYVAIENVKATKGAEANTNPARSGIWRSTNARSSKMKFTKMAGYPSKSPEELSAVNVKGTTRLYAASGTNGVYMYNGAKWTPENTGLASTSDWESITGSANASGHITLYLGATDAAVVINPATKKPYANRSAIMKSTNGTSWTSISSTPKITLDWDNYGTSSRAFISTVGDYQNFAANAAWTASYLAVDPDHPHNVYVAGRGGVWVGQQSTKTAKTKWQPADNNLMVTVNMDAAVDPANANYVYDGSMDDVFNYSCNGGTTFRKADVDTTGTITTGDVVSFDAGAVPAKKATPVYVAASARGANTGQENILTNPNPCAKGGGTWTQEGLPANSNDVPAMGVGHDGGPNGGKVVILAAMTHRGLYRIDGPTSTATDCTGTSTNGCWQRITGGPFDGTTNSGNGFILWKPKSTVVYAFDSKGVWRSLNTGRTWVKILAGSAAYSPYNSLALDPLNGRDLYVSDGGKVIRITNASTSTGPSATAKTVIGSITNAGSIVVSTAGNLFVQAGGRLLESTNPRVTVPTFTNVADTFFHQNDSGIRSMAIGSNNKIYTADNGNGFSVGTPSPGHAKS